MKEWKLELNKKAFTKVFIFPKHQAENETDFVGHLLKFNSKTYKMNVTFTDEGCLVAFVLQQTMYKTAIDNILNSIDIAYGEFLNGKEN